jgi:hypothetical protein
MNSKFLKSVVMALVLCLGGLSPGAIAQTTGSISKQSSTFTTEEIVTKGHQFFGKASRGIGEAVEYLFQSQGEPTAYIVGEEGSGAIIGGLRFGEGTIYYKDGITERIYWQGPSVGFDFGGNGSRTMVLVYNSDSPAELYRRFVGVEGSAYFVGGLGVNLQKSHNITLAPIRTGVGARLGANVGYLKYSKNPTWNPF